MAEKGIQDRILLACSRGPVRLFRNNVGTLRDAKGQYVTYGVCNPGGSDLIGWASVVITPDMVGRRVAVFVGAEVKTDTGRTSVAQERFIAAVREAGGVAGVVRSADDCAALIASAAGCAAPGER